MLRQVAKDAERLWSEAHLSSVFPESLFGHIQTKWWERKHCSLVAVGRTLERRRLTQLLLHDGNGSYAPPCDLGVAQKRLDLFAGAGALLRIECHGSSPRCSRASQAAPDASPVGMTDLARQAMTTAEMAWASAMAQE